MSRAVIKFSTLIFLLLPGYFSFSQNQIAGVVINGIDNSKLAAASVFLNNSSKGTITGNDGGFTISGISETNFELVISYTGFETVSLKITPSNIRSFHTIKLFPRKVELEEVNIESPDKDGWKKWGKLFTQNFIGTSNFASECKIENPEVLRFFRNKKNNIIRAYSLGNLIIDNKALGYKVRYQLEQFIYDPKSATITYFGYTGFEDLNKHKRRKWEGNRKAAYRGSIMHFIRSLYANTLAEEGFEVREKIKLYNNDSFFTQVYRGGNIAKTVTFDTTRYYTLEGPRGEGKIPDYIDLYNSKPYSFKKAFGVNPVTKEKTFYFPNYLQVIYNSQKSNPGQISNVFSSANTPVLISDIYLVRDERLVIYSDGLYFDPTNLLMNGYWGGCKMAETLPADYIDK